MFFWKSFMATCLLSWIKNWLGGWTQRMVVNGATSSQWPVTNCAPMTQYWGQPCSIFLSMVWMIGSRAPLVTLQMTLSWAGMFICWRGGRSFRGIWTVWINGSRTTVWGSKKQSAGSCPCVTTTVCSTTGWEKSGWEAGQYERTCQSQSTQLNMSQEGVWGQKGQWHPDHKISNLNDSMIL